MKRIVWITGASGGLGYELALEASKQGMHVVLLARNEERLQAVKREILNRGGTAQAFTMDMNDHQALENAVPNLLEKAGGIDVLINNAGFGVFEYLDLTSTETIKEMVSVNIVGLIVLTKALLPFLKAQKKGHIINVSSQAGKIATPKSIVYSATKHAVLGFTNGLRLELEEYNIHVSSVNPGPIKTPFFDQADQSGSYVKSIERWMLEPEQVAKATIRLIRHPKREVNLPRWMAMASKIHDLAPQLFERIAKTQFRKK